MKVRKTIKSIMALGTGLTMLGATVFGAMAADLGAYPSQFVKDGKFDGLMVVGASAATEDVLGVVDIATSLQYATRKVVDSSEGGEMSIEGDSYLFDSKTNVLELGEWVGQIEDKLDDEDLGVLKTTEIRNSKGTTDAEQTISFKTSEGLKAVYERNDADPDMVGPYLKVESGKKLFTYKVDFTDDLVSDVDSDNKLEDLEDEEIYMLGSTFSIVDAKVTKSGSAPEVDFTFMSGSVTDTLKEGETKTYEIDGKSYEVSVVIIADSNDANDESQVKLMINGEVTESLVDGDTDTLDDGTVIGIRDILANEGAEENGEDIVSFYIGANKIELDALAGQMTVDEETLDDVTVTVTAANVSDEVKVKSIQFAVTGEDEYYMAEGDKLSEVIEDEPEAMISENWDIIFAGLTTPGTDMINLVSSGKDSYSLEFTNIAGTEYSITLLEIDDVSTSTLMFIGEASDVERDRSKLHFQEVENTTMTPKNSSRFIGIGDMFIAGGEGEDALANMDDIETKVYEFTDVDFSNGKLTFEDVETGSEETVDFTETDFVFEDTTKYNSSSSECKALTEKLGDDDLDVTLCVSNTTGTLLNNTGINDDDVYVAVNLNGDSDTMGKDNAIIATKNGAIIQFNSSDYGNTSASSGGEVVLNISVDSDYTDNDEVQMFYVKLNATGTLTDNELKATIVENGNLSMQSSEDEDAESGMTKYGIMVSDSGDDEGNTIEISVPADQVAYKVYAVGADVSETTSSGSVVVGEVQKINVGKAVLDNEIADVSADNLIVVGGPCANSIAAELLGIGGPGTASCYEEFPVAEGEGIIKAVENGDKVAVLVAGYNAADTRNAAQVLANYEDYAEELADKEEVVVAGTQIKAAEVVEEAMEEAEEEAEEEVAEETEEDME